MVGFQIFFPSGSYVDVNTNRFPNCTSDGSLWEVSTEIKTGSGLNKLLKKKHKWITSSQYFIVQMNKKGIKFYFGVLHLVYLNYILKCLLKIIQDEKYMFSYKRWEINSSINTSCCNIERSFFNQAISFSNSSDFQQVIY